MNRLSVGTMGICIAAGGDRAGLKLIKDSGFDNVDFGLDYYMSWESMARGNGSDFLDRPIEELRTYFGELRAYTDSIGLNIAQVHSPFPVFFDECPEAYPHALEVTKKCIEICSILGAKYDIIHPGIMGGFYDSMPEKKAATFELNKKMYLELIPVLKQFDVIVGVENMWHFVPGTEHIIPTVCAHVDEMIEYIDTFNAYAGEKRFVSCLDVGHANLTGDDSADMILALGDRLETVHLHDTSRVADTHSLPFLHGFVDWNRICAALKTIGYKGNINLEINFAQKFPAEFMPAASAFAAKIAAWIDENSR